MPPTKKGRTSEGLLSVTGGKPKSSIQTAPGVRTRSGAGGAAIATSRIPTPATNKKKAAVAMTNQQQQQQQIPPEACGATEAIEIDSEDAKINSEQWTTVTPTKQGHVLRLAAKHLYGDTEGQQLAEFASALRQHTGLVQTPYMKVTNGTKYAYFMVRHRGNVDHLRQTPFVSSNSTEGQRVLAEHECLSAEDLSLVAQRTVHIAKLPTKLQATHIHGALCAFGKIDEITSNVDHRGKNRYFVVTFQTEEEIRKLKEVSESMVLVGNHMGRTSELGGVRLDWQHEQAATLTHLPMGCTQADLAFLVQQYGAAFVHIPWKTGERMRHRHAHVYFRNDEDRQRVTGMRFRIRQQETVWADNAQQCCYFCGAIDHKKSACPQRPVERQQMAMKAYAVSGFQNTKRPPPPTYHKQPFSTPRRVSNTFSYSNAVQNQIEFPALPSQQQNTQLRTPTPHPTQPVDNDFKKIIEDKFSQLDAELERINALFKEREEFYRTTPQRILKIEHTLTEVTDSLTGMADRINEMAGALAKVLQIIAPTPQTSSMGPTGLHRQQQQQLPFNASN
ncbi:hypothetical protein BGZ50_008756 [Haplosporangium sp. Z 11]|nr:hypothetical protein BGZ50_008756 [Haplosporangium sp. Z 11]